MLITFLVVPKSRSWRPITITNFVMLLIRKGSGSYSGEGTYKSVVITSGRYVFLCELLFRFSALENICSLLNTLWTSWHNLLRVLIIFKSKKALLALRLLRKFFTKILNTFDAQNFSWKWTNVRHICHLHYARSYQWIWNNFNQSINCEIHTWNSRSDFRYKYTWIHITPRRYY